VNELMELMELLRAYLEESPLMVSISHISDIHSSIQVPCHVASFELASTVFHQFPFAFIASC